MELAAIRSKASEGQRFWLSAARPSKSSIAVARVFGSRRAPARSSTSAFGSSGPAERMPRGRWYLKERPTSLTPLATSAEASVSPGWPASLRPSKVKDKTRARSIRPPLARRAVCGSSPCPLSRRPSSGALPRSRSWSSWDFGSGALRHRPVARRLRAEDLMGARVARHDEPGAAAAGVIPELAHAGRPDCRADRRIR